MLSEFRNLFDHRDLMRIWIGRDIRIRYKQSFLGAAWAILQPVALMLMFTVVFSMIIRVDTGDVPYPLFSYTAVLPWTFFSTAITFGTSSLISNLNLVSKVYFPREILPLSAIGAGLVDFLVASLVLIALMVFFRYPFHTTIFLLPVVFGIQIILMTGVIMFASAMNVFYRDIRFVVPLVLQLWLYATPIIYPIDLVPQSLRTIYMLNPMVGIIGAYRALILYGEMPSWQPLAFSLVVSTSVFLLGYRYFKHVEWQFADVI